MKVDIHRKPWVVYYVEENNDMFCTETNKDGIRWNVVIVTYF